MDVMTAVLTRRSEHVLHAPAPDDAEFTYLLRGRASLPTTAGSAPGAGSCCAAKSEPNSD